MTEYDERWSQAVREYAQNLFDGLDPTFEPAERAAQFSAQLQADADANGGRAQALRAWVVRRVSRGYKPDRAFGSAPEIVEAFQSGDFQRWLETQLRLNQ